MATKPDFWEDINQANERITNTFILYDNKPAYVLDPYLNENNENCLNLKRYKETGSYFTDKVKMDDPKLNKFRKLPLLGWFNSTRNEKCQAVYLSRVAKRSRTHGLSAGNTYAYTFKDSGDLSPCKSLNSAAYMDHFSYSLAHTEDGYPSLEDILLTIREKSSIAYSPTFCVYRCQDGVRWLFRKRNKIGMFIGIETLSLFPKLGFYREEIMSDKKFTLNTIQEF